jgi:hypothetical protein
MLKRKQSAMSAILVRPAIYLTEAFAFAANSSPERFVQLRNMAEPLRAVCNSYLN